MRTGSKRGSIAAQVNISHEWPPVKKLPSCLGTLFATALGATGTALVARYIAPAKRVALAGNATSVSHKRSGEISERSACAGLKGDAAWRVCRKRVPSEGRSILPKKPGIIAPVVFCPLYAATNLRVQRKRRLFRREPQPLPLPLALPLWEVKAPAATGRRRRPGKKLDPGRGRSQ